jgi:surfactin synthase thioesterase subunit
MTESSQVLSEFFLFILPSVRANFNVMKGYNNKIRRKM